MTHASHSDPLRTIALFAGVFSLAVGAMLLANHHYLTQNDPVFSERAKRLDALAARHLAEPENRDIKAEIMRLDQELRQRYFDRQARTDSGIVLLLAGVVIFVLSMRMSVADKEDQVPDSEPEKRSAARGILAGCAGLAAAVVIALAYRGSPPPVTGPVKTDPQPVQPGHISGSPDPGMPDGSSVLQADENTVYWPGYRGPERSGVCALTDLPEQWNESTGQNIAWKISMPQAGRSAPIVAGTTVYVSGADAKEHKLFAFDLGTGKLRWTGTQPLSPRASEVKAEAPHDFAVATPVTDEETVVAFYANGEIAAFEAKTGKLLWTHVLGPVARNQHGLTASPLMHGNRIFVPVNDKTGRLFAFETATGALKWMRTRPDRSGASPVLMPGPENNALLVTAGPPGVTGWTPGTGRRLWTAPFPETDIVASPVVAGTRVIVLCGTGELLAFDCSAQENTKPQQAWRIQLDGVTPDAPVGGLIIFDGLLYAHAGTMLVCFETETGTTVYTQPLTEKSSGVPPAIADGRLYMFAGKETIVVRPGRTFEQIGTCMLNERIVAPPAFAPGRIILRGETHLFGIGVP